MRLGSNRWVEKKRIHTCPGRACHRSSPWPTFQSCPWSARRGSSRWRPSLHSGLGCRRGLSGSLKVLLLLKQSKLSPYLDSRPECWDICPGWGLPCFSHWQGVWWDGRCCLVRPAFYTECCCCCCFTPVVLSQSSFCLHLLSGVCTLLHSWRR